MSTVVGSFLVPYNPGLSWLMEGRYGTCVVADDSTCCRRELWSLPKLSAVNKFGTKLESPPVTGRSGSVSMGESEGDGAGDG